MALLHLIWTVLAGLLFNQAKAQVVNLGPPAYTLSVSPQPRKISVLGNHFIGISGCQVVTSPIGNPGAKTLTRMDKTFDQNCDVYYISEAVDLSHTYMAIDGKGVLSIFHFTSDMQSYSRTTFYQLPYTAYYYPRVYKMERVPNTHYFFVAALQTNILFKVLVEPGGLATITKHLTNERSQSYETMAATSNNRLVTMSASGQYMELWDTTTMSFITVLEFSPFVFGNIYRSVAYYPIVSQQDFIMAPKTGLVAHFIDLTNKLIVYEFAIKQENPEFCYHVPQTNYFAVIDPANIDFLNVLNPSQSKTFAVAIGQSLDTVGAHFFTRSGTGYLLLTFSPGGAAAGRVYDLGTNFCHVTCATCAASLDPSRCTSCQIGYSLDSGVCNPTATGGSLFKESTLTPVPACVLGEYRTTYNTCKTCSTDCTSCRDFSGFCSRCGAPTLLSVNGDCVVSCATTNQFLSNGVHCKRCHPTCQKCNSVESNSCTECQTGTGLKSGVCEPNPLCSSPNNYHWFDKTCQSCFVPPQNSPGIVQSCVSCTNKNLAYSCNTCDPRLSLSNLALECYQRCPSGTVTANKQCQICEQNNGPSTVFYNRTCIAASQCPTSAPYNSTSLTCGVLLSSTELNKKDSDDDHDHDDDDKDNKAGMYLLIVFGVICFVLGTVFCIYGIVKSRTRLPVNDPSLPNGAGRGQATQFDGGVIPLEEIPLPLRDQPGQQSSNGVFSNTDGKTNRPLVPEGQKPVQHMNTVFGTPGARQDAIPVVFDQQNAVMGNPQPRKFQITAPILDSRRSVTSVANNGNNGVEREEINPSDQLKTEQIGTDEEEGKKYPSVDSKVPEGASKPRLPSTQKFAEDL